MQELHVLTQYYNCRPPSSDTHTKPLIDMESLCEPYPRGKAKWAKAICLAPYMQCSATSLPKVVSYAVQVPVFYFLTVHVPLGMLVHLPQAVGHLEE